MKIGILADIHEQVEELRQAIDRLRRCEVDQFVVLGDICATGAHLEETVDLLRGVSAIGVWGNHDYGLCVEPSEQMRKKYSPNVLDYFSRLTPRLVVDDCLFCHVEPWLNPEKHEDIWYFDGPPDSETSLSRSFAATPHRAIFIGHFHRWLHGTTEGSRPWSGLDPIPLDRAVRHLVIVNAVFRGYCGLLDTEANIFTPIGMA